MLWKKQKGNSNKQLTGLLVPESKINKQDKENKTEQITNNIPPVTTVINNTTAKTDEQCLDIEDEANHATNETDEEAEDEYDDECDDEPHRIKYTNSVKFSRL